MDKIKFSFHEVSDFKAALSFPKVTHSCNFFLTSILLKGYVAVSFATSSKKKNYISLTMKTKQNTATVCIKY